MFLYDIVVSPGMKNAECGRERSNESNCNGCSHGNHVVESFFEICEHTLGEKSDTG